MDFTKLTFTEIEAELNKAIQDFEPKPSHEASWVRDSMIKFIKGRFPNYKVRSGLTTGGEITITLPGSIEVFGDVKNYELSVNFKVKTKRTGKTIKVGRIRRKYEVTKADNPFKFYRISDLNGDLHIPCFKLNKDENGNLSISKDGDWGSGFDYYKAEGYDQVRTLNEFNEVIKDAYILDVHNSMTQPIVKRIAFTKEGDMDREIMMSTFSREHLEQFFNGAQVKDICTPIVEHMKVNNLIK